ncbi:MAG: hypothetical protein EBW14_20690, partial [Oxalobacteraceae bacterium]|nr:hypothetical protein [Oxalobacteraceae bacterium]
ESIAANTLTLNGVTLGGIDYNRPLKAPDLVSWLNATGSTLEPPVVVRGVNQIKASAALIKEGLQEDRPLVVNGVTVTGNGAAGTFNSTQEIAAAINGADTGRVVATATSQNLSRKLSINGTNITGSGTNGAFANRTELITKINLATGTTGVTAALNNVTGDITLPRYFRNRLRQRNSLRFY